MCVKHFTARRRDHSAVGIILPWVLVLGVSLCVFFAFLFGFEDHSYLSLGFFVILARLLFSFMSFITSSQALFFSTFDIYSVLFSQRFCEMLLPSNSKWGNLFHETLCLRCSTENKIGIYEICKSLHPIFICSLYSISAVFGFRLVLVKILHPN